MKKVLVIGSGGREHAIVEALSRSPQVDKIYCAPGNAGISALAECVGIGVEDVDALARFAAENAVDLTVVGPEAGSYSALTVSAALRRAPGRWVGSGLLLTGVGYVWRW